MCYATQQCTHPAYAKTLNHQSYQEFLSLLKAKSKIKSDDARCCAQLQAQDTAAALEAALASEDFEEAAALQAEHDTVAQQAAALEAAHGFSPNSPEASRGFPAAFEAAAAKLRPPHSSGGESSETSGFNHTNNSPHRWV